MLPALLLALPALAPQQSELVLSRQDFVAGRQIRTFERAVIADDGSWDVVALLDTLVHNGNGVRVGSAGLVYAEGDFLAGPGLRIDYLRNLAGSGANATQRLRGGFEPPRPYGNTEVLLGRGQELLTAYELANVQGLPATSRLSRILDTAANGNTTVVAVVGLYDAPGQALVRIELDASGTVLARTLELARGDVLPDGSVVDQIEDPRLDERGNWVVRVNQRRLVARNRVLLAEGTPSPLPGRDYQEILDFDTNDLGGLAAAVRLDGDVATDLVLLRNGAVLAQEGQLLPSLSAAVPAPVLAEIGQVQLANSGDVTWFAVGMGGGLADALVLRNLETVLQAGVTRVDGKLLLEFDGDADRLATSPSGRFLLAKVRLESTGKALVTADFGASRVLLDCARNPATLRHTDGLVLAGRTVRLELDGPARPGSLATIHLATALAQPGQPCGVPTPFGELLLDPARVVASFVAGTFAGGPVGLDLAIPADLALVNRKVYLQGAFLRPGILLSNGLSLEIGAP
ncbi:MAG TPA: hypothetical protein VF530_09475 [Planctomycetota bacterium]